MEIYKNIRNLNTESEIQNRIDFLERRWSFLVRIEEISRRKTSINVEVADESSIVKLPTGNHSLVKIKTEGILFDPWSKWAHLHPSGDNPTSVNTCK